MASITLAPNAFRTAARVFSKSSIATPTATLRAVSQRSFATTSLRQAGANAIPDEAKTSHKAAKDHPADGSSTKAPSPEEAGAKMDAMSQWKKEEQKMSQEESSGKKQTER